MMYDCVLPEPCHAFWLVSYTVTLPRFRSICFLATSKCSSSALDSPHLEHRVRVARNEQRPAIGLLSIKKGAGHHRVVPRGSLHVDNAHIIILVVPAVALGRVPVPAPHSCRLVALGNAISHLVQVVDALEYLVLSHLEPLPHTRTRESSLRQLISISMHCSSSKSS